MPRQKSRVLLYFEGWCCHPSFMCAVIQMAVVQCELVQLWKGQAARLRHLYCSWKPRQRGNPFISCHVWFLPCLLATWLTVFLSILLLALYLHEKMAVGKQVTCS